MTVRFAVRRVCLVALMGPLMAIGACGGDPVALSDEPWPLTLSDPAVFGYAALRPTGDALERFAIEAFGWTPAGLDADLPVVLVHFDARTYGGALGVLIPLQDERAFRASLASAPTLESLGNGRYRMHLAPGSLPGMMLGIAARLEGPSPLGAINALADANALTFPLTVEIRGGHALVAPSLEALGVCRRLLRATGGFEAAPRRSLVVSLALDRIRVGHAERIRKWEEQLRNLVSGARTGGALMGMMAMAASQPSAAPPLPVNWEMVWALKEMLAVGEMDALQVRIDRREDGTAPAQPDDEEAGPDDLRLDGRLDWVGGLSVRLAFSDASRLADVLDTLTPGVEVAGTDFTLRADPERFGRAFAEWCRPLAEVVKGEGPPCDRYLDELVGLLSGWSGLLAFRTGEHGHPMVLLGMSSDGAVESEALANWLEPFLATARIEGLGEGVRAELLADGRLVFMDAGGEPALTVGRSGVVLWVALGASDPPEARSVDAVETALAAVGGNDPPGLRFSAFGAKLHLSVRSRELRLDLSLADRGR